LNPVTMLINLKSWKLKTCIFLKGDRKVLENVHLEVNAGELIGIAGPIGSGKSTLTKLLIRVLEPPENTVFVNGIDVRHIPLKELRSLVT